MRTFVQYSGIPFWKLLRVARQAQDFTQEELAQAVGLNRSVINRYEHGLWPNPSHVPLLEAALDIEFDDPDFVSAVKSLVKMNTNDYEELAV